MKLFKNTKLFFKLNKKKFIYRIIITYSICIILFLISYISYKIEHSNDWSPENHNHILEIFTLLLIIFPIIALSLMIRTWNKKLRTRNKIYKTTILNDLNEIGFENHNVYTQSKLQFSEILKLGHINDYPVIIDFNKMNKNEFYVIFITFSIPRNCAVRKASRYELYKNNLELSEFYYPGIHKEYNLKNFNFNSIQDFKEELHDIAKQLLSLDIKPAENKSIII